MVVELASMPLMGVHTWHWSHLSPVSILSLLRRIHQNRECHPLQGVLALELGQLGVVYLRAQYDLVMINLVVGFRFLWNVEVRVAGSHRVDLLRMAVRSIVELLADAVLLRMQRLYDRVLNVLRDQVFVGPARSV